jgi:uroporphyrinogen decarboxylase
MGIVSKQRQDGASRPYYIEWPVRDRDSWERLKAERFRPDLAARLPADWPWLVEEYRHRTYPLAIASGYCGFFGSLRALLGEERLLYAYYDEHDLLHDILDYLCDFWIDLYTRALEQVQADSAEFWEDMAYRNGPLISPALFRQFMLPRYQRLIGALRQSGVTNFCVDTDGDCRQLIPLFLEAGMTAMLPFEVQAGMDIVEVRRHYPHLQIYGGLDKRALAQDAAAIDRELEKTATLLRQGGYIPMADHLIPPDVPWANFVYYRRRLAELAAETASLLRRR